MYEEDKLDDLRKFLDDMDELLKKHKDYKYRRAMFTVELIERIGTITYKHFSDKTSYHEIKEKIASDKDFKYYAIWIFDELINNIEDFSDDEIPAGKKLFYKKIEYRSFTDEAIEEQIKKLKKTGIIFNSEQWETLRGYYKQDFKIEEYYKNFKILLHNELKKLALEFFPELTEISAAGIREIDYMLHKYMLKIYENIMNILQDVVNVSMQDYYASC
jgi:hypothetical protein